MCRTLAEEVFSRYGVPLQVVTDQGKEFENRLLRGLCDCYGIENVRTSPYRPSTNGAIERLHRTINVTLGRIIDESQRDWNVRVPAVLAAYRARQLGATEYSLNLLMFERELRAPVDIVLGDLSQIDYSAYDPYLEDFLENQCQAYALAREQLKKNATGTSGVTMSACGRPSSRSGRGYYITVRENL